MKKRPSQKRDKKVTVAKKSQPNITAARWQAIKPYVNFKNTGTEYSKRKIREVHRILAPALKQPHTSYKSRSGDNLKLVARRTGLDDAARSKWLKAVPVPNNDIDPEEIKIRVVGKGRNKRVVQESRYTSTEFIDLDPDKLAVQGAAYVARRIKPYDPKKNLFQIQTGQFHMEEAFTKEVIPGRIQQMMLKYVPGAKVQMTNSRGHEVRREVDENTSWENWLHGLQVHTGKNQKSVAEVLGRREKEKREGYKEQRKERDRARSRAYYRKKKRQQKRRR
jgi:hypothetical protein